MSPKDHEKSHPDVTIAASYAGSKIIATQIANGAEADVVVMSWPAVEAVGPGLDPPVVIFKNRTAIGVNKSGVGKVHEFAISTNRACGSSAARPVRSSRVSKPKRWRK